MCWTILIFAVSIAIISIFTAIQKKEETLSAQTLQDRFSVMIDMLNSFAFDGKATIGTISEHSFNLYRPDEHQVINFSYHKGTLTITWRYPYHEKEIIHSLNLPKARYISFFQQEKLVDRFIDEMIGIVQDYKYKILNNFNH